MEANDPHRQLVGTSADPSSTREAEQYWTTMARTADLVRKLTSLADRYDAATQDADPQAAVDRRQRVSLMRTTAESGRRLIRSQAPPATNDREQSTSAPDVDSQARTYALVTRLEESAVLRQAQGILMERAGLTAGEAFEALLLAATGPMTLQGVADHVVRRGQLPGGPDVT